jgi:hypothetical protein
LVASVTLRAGTFLVITVLLVAPVAAAAPEGQLTWGAKCSWEQQSGLGLMAGYAFSAPYEDVTLKAR